MLDRGEITWSCHACGRVRPDEEIAVHSDSTPIAGGRSKMGVNVRYCADSASCHEGAIELAKKWLAPHQSAEIAQRESGE